MRPSTRPPHGTSATGGHGPDRPRTDPPKGEPESLSHAVLRLRWGALGRAITNDRQRRFARRWERGAHTEAPRRGSAPVPALARGERTPVARQKRFGDRR
jgi:hypothetical protein